MKKSKNDGTSVGPTMVETNTAYRPIEGLAVGVVEKVEGLEVFWRYKKTVFVIPLERFEEYFCRN